MGRWLLYRFYTSNWFIFFKHLTTSIHLGKKGNQVTLYCAILNILDQLKRAHIQSYSKAVAFNFTLAIFPAIIFLFTLIPFFTSHLQLVDITEDTVFIYLESAIPAGMYEEVKSTILGIISKKQGNFLSFGFLFTLFMATNGMMSLMNSFNLIYKTKDNRNVLYVRLLALILTISLTLVLFSSFVVIILGSSILEIISTYDILPEQIINTIYDYKAMEYGVFIFLFVIAISLIYYFAPAVSHRWRFFSIGSIVASILIICLSVLFSYYISNFGSYNKIYGSIGTLIGFMVWVQTVAYILMVGYILNAGIDAAKMKELRKNLS